MTDVRTGHLKRFAQLKLERSSWIPRWKDNADNFLPYNWRYFQAERNKGWRQNGRIIDNTPLIALRTLANGMMAGLTSKARPWFRLTTSDPQLAESGPVRAWCSDVEDILRQVLARSNIYKALHKAYLHLAGFGTNATQLDEDDHDVIRAYTIPLGQYCLAGSHRLVVDTFFREFSMTAQQLVDRFGEENASDFAKNALKQNTRDTWIDCLHVVEPNADFDPRRMDKSGKRWGSVYMELSARDGMGGTGMVVPGSIGSDRLLFEGGYEEFPLLCARWDTNGEDVYGFCPADDGLGDAKSLQQLQRRKMQGFDKVTNPAMVAPSALRTQRNSMLPGDWIFADQAGPGTSVRAAYEMPPAALQAFREEIVDTRQRINAGLYADLWLALTNDEGTMTAREVNERHEEKMLQLGPALESIETEVLDPLVHRALSILGRRGMLPEPPPELVGQGVKPEYISIMAQAQKLLGITADERLVAMVTSIAQFDPTVIDNVNSDKLITVYADRLGNKPEVIRDMKEVQALRQQRAQKQQAQEQGQAMMAAAKGAKDLSGADMAGDNVLSRLMGGLGPNAAASAGTGTVQ